MSRSQDQTENLRLLSGGHLKRPDEGPGAHLLEAFPNCYAGRLYVITIDFPEFTSLCPVTGQPDFGRIFVEYLPHKLCVESKSFKQYMFAFRNHHSFMETITNTILDDLWSVVQPYWCRVQGLFAPRGGARINVFAEQFASLSGKEEASVKESVAQYRMDCQIQRFCEASHD
ncbi:MAG: NADPH-dependent 7-cyano-7-deazaguanine reductase QueF [Desulfovibrio sp.]|nr:NADPH-dependent 7-cyano-7-deazaguanine reductase QueF [Desulfovibrio sp.]